jgi:hypothetical protein
MFGYPLPISSTFAKHLCGSAEHTTYAVWELDREYSLLESADVQRGLDAPDKAGYFPVG